MIVPVALFEEQLTWGALRWPKCRALRTIVRN